VTAHIITELVQVCGREPLAEAFIRHAVVDDVSKWGGMHDAVKNGHSALQDGQVMLRREIPA
jgi:hypothetical protein